LVQIVSDSVHSGSGRTALADNNTDYYPVPLSADTLRPGTVYAEIQEGHMLREQIVILHRRLLAIVRDDDVCRRLMTAPGVDPVVALTYRATVDVPARFRNPRQSGRCLD
jgi:transposase